MTGIIEALFKALGAGLGLWQSKEKRKYLDKLLKLEKDYYEAINQPEDQWDDAVIDNITFELQLLGKAFHSSVGKSDTED
jgi:hypothetical protein